jgi:hypothetical protein
MAEKHVRIQVELDDDGDANFTYIPAVLWVRPRDTVSWSSPDGPFGLIFKKSSPSLDVDAHGRACGEGDERGFATQSLEIREGALGHYHYAVAISLEAGVFLDAACPEIIVKGN